ncbi:MAG: NADP-dependent glyceraldehyde-3-phosphate dehydrogenase [Bacteroidota bacterium]
MENIFPQWSDIPAEYRIDKAVHQNEYLINGQLLKWDGPFQDVVSPVYLNEQGTLTPKFLGHYPLLTQAQSMAALDAAVAAFDHGRGLWPTMSVEDRIYHLELFTLKMMETREEVVRLLMWEIGKTLGDAQKEFDRTVDYIRDTIQSLKELDRTSSRFSIEQGIMAQIRRAPFGVALCMGPYNYPLNETFTTLIPALIMGNVIIFKPPKFGVLLHSPLLKAFKESFPPGVINTVYGDGESVIRPLMESGKIDVLAFIGSSRVADILKHQHPKPHRMRSVLGLEAKNAAIILKDADIEQVTTEVVLGALSYNGQRCTALKIIFVHESIAEPFLTKFSEKVSALKAGMPWEKDVKITPLPEAGKIEYLNTLIEDAQKYGAKIINANGGNCNRTVFFPAVLFPVNEKMRVYHEEQFGPVVPVVAFSSINEPVEYIINSNYGQQVSIFGNDADEISELIDPLVNQVCRVNINSQCQRGPDSFPFTGRKDSAEGTLSVSDALRVFSIRTLVAAKSSPTNNALVKEIIRENKSNFLSTDFIF